MSGPLEPDSISQLATDAIEAKVTSDEDRVLEVLQTILVDGNKRDGLAFVIACVYTIACGLTPGVRMVLGPVQVFGDGLVGPTPGATPAQGQRLFSEMLGAYLVGDFPSVRDLWITAEDTEAAGAVGVAIWAAAVMVRNRRAMLQ